MEADTKHCSACNERLPHDAVFCSACGTAQKAPPSSAAPGAFALVEDQPHTTPTPATPPPAAPEPPASDSIELESVQLDDGDLDDGLLEEGEAEADEVELEEISLEDDEESGDEGTAVVKTAELPPTEAAVPAAPNEASPAEESEETSNTVRMSMSDVMQAWNEEARPDADAEPASDEPAAPAAKGLPPGFIVALIASLAVVALLVYLLA